ncbi:hypothetical protein NDU88_003142 [Pleurodeles waltl]|uniref:Uncharacterized protein n=1 Tax=Pleurodeles waltl TaxID=8319 RepID=A0AAV7KU17_PLEWA|nr:hypothetical protein NDU88_003142 [Pleurodeles waltl]
MPSRIPLRLRCLQMQAQAAARETPPEKGRRKAPPRGPGHRPSRSAAPNMLRGRTLLFSGAASCAAQPRSGCPLPKAAPVNSGGGP